MKRIALLIVSFLTIFTAQAIDLTGVKIYINPGHGGYDSNDRSVGTIPVPEVLGIKIESGKRISIERDA